MGFALIVTGLSCDIHHPSGGLFDVLLGTSPCSDGRPETRVILVPLHRFFLRLLQTTSGCLSASCHSGTLLRCGP